MATDDTTIDPNDTGTGMDDDLDMDDIRTDSLTDDDFLDSDRDAA